MKDYKTNSTDTSTNGNKINGGYLNHTMTNYTITEGQMRSTPQPPSPNATMKELVPKRILLKSLKMKVGQLYWYMKSVNGIRCYYLYINSLIFTLFYTFIFRKPIKKASRGRLLCTSRLLISLTFFLLENSMILSNQNYCIKGSCRC